MSRPICIRCTNRLDCSNGIHETKSTIRYRCVKCKKENEKDKGFARALSREEIINDNNKLGLTLDEHIQIVLDTMKGIKEELGFR